MKIRVVRKKEMKDVLKIMIKEFSKSPWNEKWTPKKALKTLKSYGGKIYVALENKEILGFILVNEFYYFSGPCINIEEFVISKKYQGKGVGKKLLEYIEKMYREKKFSKIYLLTMKKAEAYKFYRKKGFYDSKYNAYMEKKLV